MKLNKGFTLIELLVVIAIIGILSSVVLASLNTARNKGANAAVKSNLSGMRAAAELAYDDANSYDGICADELADARVSAANASGTTDAAADTDHATSNICLDALGYWVASTQLKVAEGSDNYFCVDYTGKAETITTAEHTALSTAVYCP